MRVTIRKMDILQARTIKSQNTLKRKSEIKSQISVLESGILVLIWTQIWGLSCLGAVTGIVGLFTSTFHGPSATTCAVPFSFHGPSATTCAVPFSFQHAAASAAPSSFQSMAAPQPCHSPSSIHALSLSYSSSSSLVSCCLGLWHSFHRVAMLTMVKRKML